MARLQRPLLWVASSKRDYLEFPPHVQDGFGFELFLVQTGQHPPSAKPLRGLGSGTLELIENFDGDTYRPFTPCASPKPCMSCTRSRRNRSEALRLRRPTSSL